MKFCPKCGNQLGDNVSFCNRCGADVKGAAAAGNQNGGFNGAAPQPQYATPQPQFNGQVNMPQAGNMNAPGTAIEVIKAIGKSPLFLAAVVAMTLSVLFNFFYQISGSNAAFDSLRETLGRIGLDREAREIVNSMEGVSVGSILISMVPSILIVIGLWLTYVSLSNRTGPISTVGLTMIKVINIIELVFMCIAFAIVEIVLIAGMVGVSIVKNDTSSADGKTLAGLAGGLLVVGAIVLAAVFVLMIVYLSQIISSINTAKRTIATGVASDKVSAFVAVMSFIAAFFNVISLFSGDGALHVLGALCGIASSICFGVLIFKYKNAMRPIMYQGSNFGNIQ